MFIDQAEGKVSLVLSEQTGHQSNRARSECELHEHLSFQVQQR